MLRYCTLFANKIVNKFLAAKKYHYFELCKKILTKLLIFNQKNLALVLFLSNVYYYHLWHIYKKSADTWISMGVGATILGYDLSSDYLLTVLDNDSACFICRANSADGVSLRGTDWHAERVFSNTACSTCQLIKFLLSLSQLLAETWVALQFCIKN